MHSASPCFDGKVQGRATSKGYSCGCDTQPQRARDKGTKEMNRVPEIEKFTVSIEGNRLTAKIIGDDGTRIKIPSAMWPLKGKRDYCFFSENTIPCEDEAIRSI